MRIKLPLEVAYILSQLEKYAYDAFIVGGCVRDTLMGNIPNDWDVCTSALPNQIIACFPSQHIIETGRKYGTLTLLLNNIPYEITTYRIDGEYTDNRRPERVTFTKRLDDDLARRDFTINAIAYSPKTGLVDPFGGVAAIEKKEIQCVGDARQRFAEDALRIMRAVRFASTLAFAIQADTSRAISENYYRLSAIAPERIQAEFCKLLLGNTASKVLLQYAAVIGHIIPEAKPMFGQKQNNPYHVYDVWEHTVQSIGAAAPNIYVRLALFFHDIAKPHCYTQDENGVGHFYKHASLSAEIAENAMKRLRFSNNTIAIVRKLVAFHDAEFQTNEKNAKKWLNKLGKEELFLLLQVKRADILAQAKWCQQERLEALATFTCLVEETLHTEQCFSLKNLAINGNDIVELGVPSGPRVGEILNTLLTMAIEGEIDNDREKMLAYIQKEQMNDR